MLKSSAIYGSILCVLTFATGCHVSHQSANQASNGGPNQNTPATGDDARPPTSGDDTSEGSDELTNQARAIFRSFDDTVTDSDVQKALADVAGVVSRAGTVPVKESIGKLAKSDLPAAVQTNMPDSAAGVVAITNLDCSLDQVQKLYTAKNQIALYPGSFDKLDRAYAADVNTFIKSGAPKLNWNDAYTRNTAGFIYDGKFVSGARIVKGAGPNGASVLITHVYQPEPPHFTKGDGGSLNQYYQAELYYETAPNQVTHVVAHWLDFQLPSLSSADPTFASLYLGILVDTDKRTSTLCKSGTPTPAFE